MRKILVGILALIMAFGIVGCSNDAAEENEVMSNFRNYAYYYEAGGTYDMIYIYLFDSDGTYVSTISSDISTSRYEGTFEINTSRDTIKCKPSDGGAYTLTYSLYDGGMKLFSDTKEYERVSR